MACNTWILIPAHNEEEAIADVLLEVRQCCRWPILVVDSCSTDRTFKVASQYADCVIRAKQIGYWKALQTGYQYLIETHDVDSIVQLDSDGQHDPIHIPKLHHHLGNNTQPTWVCGSRFQTGTVSEGVLALGQRIFRLGLQLKFGGHIQDVSSGFWAINRPVMEAFLQYQPRGQTADVVLRGFALRRGIVCVEIPTAMKPREKGVSMHLGLKSRLRHVQNVIQDAKHVWWN
jgi:glycosyltransferase involved in cell wall biosynthesis